MGRATVLDRVQVGPEVTAGTAVAANKRLLSTVLTPVPEIGVRKVRGVGSKIPVATAIGKEWTAAVLDGELTYTDLCYFLAAHIVNPSITGNTWTFVLRPFDADAVKTHSVEAGSASRAEKFAYGFVPDLQMRFTDTECALSGQMLGRKLTEGAALTASPTVIAPIAVAPKDWKVLIGDAVASLTQVNGVLEADFVSRGRFKPQGYADGTDTFAELIELGPAISVGLNLDHNSDAAGFIGDFRTAKRRVARIKATGGTFTVGMATLNYDLQITMPFTFSENGRGDAEGVYASDFTLEPEYDATFANAVEIVVVTSITGL